jgi:hypothetical protein
MNTGFGSIASGRGVAGTRIANAYSTLRCRSKIKHSADRSWFKLIAKIRVTYDYDDAEGPIT